MRRPAEVLTEPELRNLTPSRFRDSTSKKGDAMTTEVPEAARRLAGELADAFETDRGLAEQLNACQHRLRVASSDSQTRMVLGLIGESGLG